VIRGNRVMSFGKSKAKQLSKDHPKTTFADVADEAVEELVEIKDFLQNPARYQVLGAKIPKGVLLYGPPGTGKCRPKSVPAGRRPRRSCRLRCAPCRAGRAPGLRRRHQRTGNRGRRPTHTHHRRPVPRRRRGDRSVS
jgi:hypothetical protein